MAIESTGYLLLGLASLALLLVLFSSTLSDLGPKLYCHIYATLLTRLPFTDVSPPTSCMTSIKQVNTEEWYYNNKDKVITKLASKLIACYVKGTKSPLEGKMVCTEVFIKRQYSFEIKEEDITQYLYDNGLCAVLPNNDIDLPDPNDPTKTVKCGQTNKLEFKKNINGQTKHLFIIYDFKSDKVIVE